MTSISHGKMNYTNLRLRMKRAGYTGTSLANRVNMPTRTLNRWLDLGEPMPADLVARIGTVLDMTPDEIAEDLLGLRIKQKQMTKDEVLAGLAELLRRYA